MNYIVTTTNITKQYKDTTALNHVSLHIPKGSVYGSSLCERYEKGNT